MRTRIMNYAEKTTKADGETGSGLFGRFLLSFLFFHLQPIEKLREENSTHRIKSCVLV